tara:strand:- start:33289 stop:34380 length:1092 start_codon:yes stop_codon:yes gene_type:complete
MPGTTEVAALVKGLEVEYATASWDTRNKFTPATKPSVGRVKHSWRATAPSPLPREVRPEDVVEAAKKAWSEMDEHDYDGNYIASTDPIHPVSTDYSHPLDDDDGSWILQHLSPEDIQPSTSADSVDFSTASPWTWNDDNSHQEIQAAPESDPWSPANDTTVSISTPDIAHTSTTLTAWGPDANTPPHPQHICTLAPVTDDTLLNGTVDKVLRSFWAVVNNDSLNVQHRISIQPAQYDGSLDLLSSPSISHTSNTPSISPPPDPAQHQSPRPDSPANPAPPPPPPPSHTSASTPPPRPNSTRAWYDNQRQMLTQRRDLVDARKFYADWLFISRCEIRDVEGVGGCGRVIGEPGGRGGGAVRELG